MHWVHTHIRKQTQHHIPRCLPVEDAKGPEDEGESSGETPGGEIAEVVGAEDPQFGGERAEEAEAEEDDEEEHHVGGDAGVLK